MRCGYGVPAHIFIPTRTLTLTRTLIELAYSFPLAHAVTVDGYSRGSSLYLPIFDASQIVINCAINMNSFDTFQLQHRQSWGRSRQAVMGQEQAVGTVRQQAVGTVRQRAAGTVQHAGSQHRATCGYLHAAIVTRERLSAFRYMLEYQSRWLAV